MKPFLDALAERVLVCDGAMGTMLYGKGVFINRCFESLTMSEPALVRELHEQYLRAGADVIETNTFGANRMKLRAFGLGRRLLLGMAARRDVGCNHHLRQAAVHPVQVARTHFEPLAQFGHEDLGVLRLRGGERPRGQADQ